MIKEFSEVNGLGSQRTLDAVIEHYKQQATKVKSDIDNIHVDLFIRLVSLADKQFQNGDIESLALTMMDIGSVVKRIRMSYEYHIQDKGVGTQQAKAVTAHFNSTSGHRERTQKQNMVKEHAQKLADLYWAKDTEQRIRVGEMAEIVYRGLVDFCSYMNSSDEKHDWLDKFLPENHDSKKYREWLKEVAPEYAKKGGRPKK